MLIGWVELIAGLLILLVGGEFLVRASVKLAVQLQISSAVIGLTIVSFGTSFPELVVSMDAALGGHPDISVGNVIGSNIANLALVLGLTVLIFPIAVARTSVLLDWPVMLGACLLLVAFGLDLELSRWEGAVLFALLGLYNFWIIRKSRRDFRNEMDIDTQVPKGRADLLRPLLILVVSIVGLILGADLLVKGAVVVAQSFQVEERVIALTVVAFGTSAPELATSLVAVYRKEAGLSIGNLIGSNIFNVLGILGITAVVNPIPVNEQIVNADFFWFIGIPLALFPFLLIRMKVTRMEGVLLLAAYCVYIYLLF